MWHCHAGAGQVAGKPPSPAFPFKREMANLANKCKLQLLNHGRPAYLVKLPVPVQIVVLNCLANFACQRPEAVEEVLTVLMQATSSYKDIGAHNALIFSGEQSTVHAHCHLKHYPIRLRTFRFSSRLELSVVKDFLCI
jgi:hypothetical protein